MISARAALICALFFIDIKVHAGEHNHAAEAVEAVDCWGKILPCAVQTSRHRRTLKAAGFEMTMSPHSIVEQRDAKTVQLVKGDYYLAVDGLVKFNTPYAEIRCSNECKGIFNRSEKNIEIKSLEGQWVIKRLGDKQEYALRAGLQVKVSEVEENGMAEMEFPQGLPFNATVKEWAKFYSGEYKEFKEEVTVFRQSWQEAVEQVSQAQLENATRSIASHQSEIDKQRAAKAAAEREDAELRKLFREKNNFQP